jgi:hypothetical protein
MSSPSRFPCKSTRKREPTSGLEPLTCSTYEFACAHPSPYWCVRDLCLFRGFSMIWRYRFVHCVPARISPVAVRLQYMGGRQLVLGMIPSPFE